MSPRGGTWTMLQGGDTSRNDRLLRFVGDTSLDDHRGRGLTESLSGENSLGGSHPCTGCASLGGLPQR